MILVTIGDDDTNALRVCLGKLSRRGTFHSWWPDVFLIRDGKRVEGRERGQSRRLIRL